MSGAPASGWRTGRRGRATNRSPVDQGANAEVTPLVDLAHLGDVADAAAPVGAPADLHHQVEGRAELLADDGMGEIHVAHQHHGLEPTQGIARAVGVTGRQRALVARVHGLQHVQGLTGADLPDDDAVGTHAQRGPHQVADAHLAHPFGVGRARLEPHHVGTGQAQLGGVLDGDHPLVGRDGGCERVQQRRLARARAARHDDVGPGPHRPIQQRGHPRSGDVVEVDRSGPEATDGEAGPVDGQRGHDGMHPRPVGQPGVDDRGAPDRRGGRAGQRPAR